jgi:hypothetical protein
MNKYEEYKNVYQSTKSYQKNRVVTKKYSLEYIMQKYKNVYQCITSSIIHNYIKVSQSILNYKVHYNKKKILFFFG